MNMDEWKTLHFMDLHLDLFAFSCAFGVETLKQYRLMFSKCSFIWIKLTISYHNCSYFKNRRHFQFSKIYESKQTISLNWIHGKLYLDVLHCRFNGVFFSSFRKTSKEDMGDFAFDLFEFYRCFFLFSFFSSLLLALIHLKRQWITFFLS